MTEEELYVLSKEEYERAIDESNNMCGVLFTASLNTVQRVYSEDLVEKAGFLLGYEDEELEYVAEIINDIPVMMITAKRDFRPDEAETVYLEKYMYWRGNMLITERPGISASEGKEDICSLSKEHAMAIVEAFDKRMVMSKREVY